ncbi:MAG: hypothetical protein JWO78_287 [Micavibrio sp.]|nr:hypothetical protein [Micavibrio sp.]
MSAQNAALAIQPMQWGRLDDLHDTAPLGQDDFECMRAVREVLMKFNKVERFALHLVHKHFDLADDEVLVEYSNANTREQYFKPEKADSEIARDTIPTTWMLKDMEPSVICVCAKTENGHQARHAEA